MGALFGQVACERGRSPVATNEQVPGADTVLQDLQVSVQAELQQTPSTQKPLAQSLSQPHTVPFVFAAPLFCAQLRCPFQRRACWCSGYSNGKRPPAIASSDRSSANRSMTQRE